MQTPFTTATWIWYTNCPAPDTYGDFTDRFSYTGGKGICRLSCDGDYTLRVNGRFVACYQYGDFEHYKIYDEIDITEYLTVGENTVDITVWHMGIPCYHYKPAKAGLIYEVVADDNVLCCSGTDTLCRENPHYRGEYKKIITLQVGQSFLYDATRPSDTPFHPAVAADKTCTLFPRPIPKLRLADRQATTLLVDEGTHFLIDLGEECVGLPTLRFSSARPQTITVAWGEHMNDGGVRRFIDGRDFSFEYVAKAGQNDYTNHMIRLGCRYLEVFCEAPITVEYIGLIPQSYPVAAVPKAFRDPRKQRLYDICVNTLKLCLFDHYVDTPWREQGFYALDSRNQMLFGYRAFENGNRDYVRANLLLLGNDRREDGLLSITTPCGDTLAIPSFSLHFFTAVREYLDYTDDLSLAQAVYDKLACILSVFEKQLRDGVLYSFGDACYWNFYDWSPYMFEEIHLTDSKPDLMNSVLFIIAVQNFRIISERLGKPFDYTEKVAALKAGIRNTFFDAERGLFSMSPDCGEFTELANSLAVIAGVTTEEETAVIAKALADGALESCSLSMKCFKYDVMLKADPAYRAAVNDEIMATYAVMLDSNSPTVWEVIDGADGFAGAGSLCHGWSAVPVLYLED